jgi:hypothetical protein
VDSDVLCMGKALTGHAWLPLRTELGRVGPALACVRRRYHSYCSSNNIEAELEPDSDGSEQKLDIIRHNSIYIRHIRHKLKSGKGSPCIWQRHTAGENRDGG